MKTQDIIKDIELQSQLTKQVCQADVITTNKRVEPGNNGGDSTGKDGNVDTANKAFVKPMEKVQLADGENNMSIEEQHASVIRSINNMSLDEGCDLRVNSLDEVMKTLSIQDETRPALQDLEQVSESTEDTEPVKSGGMNPRAPTSGVPVDHVEPNRYKANPHLYPQDFTQQLDEQFPLPPNKFRRPVENDETLVYSSGFLQQQIPNNFNFGGVASTCGQVAMTTHTPTTAGGMLNHVLDDEVCQSINQVYSSAEIRAVLAATEDLPLDENMKINSISDWIQTGTDATMDSVPSPDYSYTDSPEQIIQVCSPYGSQGSPYAAQGGPMSAGSVDPNLQSPAHNLNASYHQAGSQGSPYSNHASVQGSPPRDGLLLGAVLSPAGSVASQGTITGSNRYEPVPAGYQPDESSQGSYQSQNPVLMDPARNPMMFQPAPSPDSGVSESGYNEDPKAQKISAIIQDLKTSGDDYLRQKEMQKKIEEAKKTQEMLQKKMNMQQPLQTSPICIHPLNFDPQTPTTKPRATVNPMTAGVYQQPHTAGYDITTCTPLPNLPLFTPNDNDEKPKIPEIKSNMAEIKQESTIGPDGKKRGRGRPKGSKNKVKPPTTIQSILPNNMPPATTVIIMHPGMDIVNGKLLIPTTAANQKGGYIPIQPRPTSGNNMWPAQGSMTLPPPTMANTILQNLPLFNNIPGAIIQQPGNQPQGNQPQGNQRQDYKVNDKESDLTEKEKKGMVRANRQVAGIPPDKLSYVDEDGDTLLHDLALHENYQETLDFLFTEKKSESLLTIGVVKCRYMFRALMERMERDGCLKDNINRNNNLKQTPLYLAVTTNKPDLLSLLIEKGADPNVWTQYGKTAFRMALHVAASQGREFLPVLKILLNAPKIDIDARNSDQKTALHVAVESHGNLSQTRTIIDSKETTRELIQQGARILRGPNDKTPLHTIAERNDLDFMKYFVELIPADKRVDLLNMKDSNGNTCLHIVTSLFDTKDIFGMVQYLLVDCKVDFAVKNNKSDGPKRLVKGNDKKDKKENQPSERQLQVLELFNNAEKQRRNAANRAMTLQNNAQNAQAAQRQNPAYVGQMQQPQMTGTNHPMGNHLTNIPHMAYTPNIPMNSNVTMQPEQLMATRVKNEPVSNYDQPMTTHLTNGQSWHQPVTGHVTNGQIGSHSQQQMPSHFTNEQMPAYQYQHMMTSANSYQQPMASQFTNGGMTPRGISNKSPSSESESSKHPVSIKVEKIDSPSPSQSESIKSPASNQSESNSGDTS